MGKFKKKSTLAEKKIILVFFFYLITIYCTSLNCIDQKRHKKKSLNNKPIKTITEHLIKMTNHKMHGGVPTHSQVSLNGTP